MSLVVGSFFKPLLLLSEGCSKKKNRNYHWHLLTNYQVFSKIVAASCQRCLVVTIKIKVMMMMMMMMMMISVVPHSGCSSTNGSNQLPVTQFCMCHRHYIRFPPFFAQHVFPLAIFRTNFFTFFSSSWLDFPVYTRAFRRVCIQWKIKSLVGYFTLLFHCCGISPCLVKRTRKIYQPIMLCSVPVWPV